jgi:hypothetical protein
MDARGGLEEIAEQTSCRIDVGTRQRQIKKPGCKWGHAISPNLTHSKVAREKKPQQSKPAVTKPAPKAAANPIPAKLGRSFSDYRTLIETCRSRADELGLSRLEIDRIGGLPTGYASKLLGRDGSGPRQKKMWPVSLEAMLGALGLRVLLIEDEAATARTLAQRTPVDRANQRFGNVSRISTTLLAPPSQPTSPPLLTVVPAKRSARRSKYG